MLDVYRKYYDFTGEPFRLGPDHRFSLDHTSYANAKAYLQYAIFQAEGFVMITGVPGTGKTTLIGEMLSIVDKEKIKISTLTSTQLESRDLLYLVAHSFNIQSSDNSKAAFLLAIESFLVEHIRSGQRAILIVDEAQSLSESAIEELRLLANLQHEYHLMLQIILVGQEQLLDLIQRPTMEQLRQRLVAAATLEALGLDEAINYIEHRLSRVAWKGDPKIDEGALRLVHQHSGGIPRRINLIMNRLFLSGGMEEKHHFTAKDAQEVIKGLMDEYLLVANPLIDEVDTEAKNTETDDGRPRYLPREPVEKPKTEKPKVEKLEPEAEKSEAEKPKTEKPKTEKPKTEKPKTEKSETEKSETEKPETEKPETEKPKTEKSETEKPVAERLATEMLAAERLAAERLAVERLAVERLAAERPAAEKVAQVSPVASERPHARSSHSSADDRRAPETGTQMDIGSARRGQAEPRRSDNRDRKSIRAAGLNRRSADALAYDAQKKKKRGRGLFIAVILLVGVSFAYLLREESDSLNQLLSMQEDSGGQEQPGAVVTSLDEPAPKAGEIDEALPAEEKAPVNKNEVAKVPDQQPQDSVPEPAPASIPSEGDHITEVALASSVDKKDAAPTVTVDPPVPEIETQPVEITREAEKPSVPIEPPVHEPPAQTVSTSIVDTLETRRVQLRREAEQRFTQRQASVLGRTTAPVRQVLPAPPATNQVASVTASSLTTGGNLTSQPKRQPQFTADKMKRIILQGRWSSAGKPASLLPSEATFCRRQSGGLSCNSVPQNVKTQYGLALYRVETKLSRFSPEGHFEMAYRTLVRLIDDDASTLPTSDDDGWQITDYSMSCTLAGENEVSCLDGKGITREYRRASLSNR